ncbi:hypothetical protein F7725_021569 [Dissostichus mawsoni]|uniref:Uncharacterized protein n=1 Tax=Dissostichus mawsoni TaxID=36200 RepID=A0A7J5ZC74_DISMA|nr:hypothetical protein F7725_021569 [Dissostichus mawsoni]
MPSCSGSESKDSGTWPLRTSGLDAGLAPELVALREAGESDCSEPVQWVSSPGDGSGRILTDSEAEAVEAGEWLWKLDVLVMLVMLGAVFQRDALSKQEVIPETECRLTPVEESTSCSTTGVSMGTL